MSKQNFIHENLYTEHEREREREREREKQTHRQRQRGTKYDAAWRCLKTNIIILF